MTWRIPTDMRWFASGEPQKIGGYMDIETMARAMFEAFHARFSRVRNWMAHPNHDGGQEHGRDTFRVMAQAVTDVLEQPSPVDAPVAAPAVEETAPEGQALTQENAQ